MKLRNGLVSNSSTSSFLIYGTQVDRWSLKRRICEINEEDLKKELREYYEENPDEDMPDLENKTCAELLDDGNNVVRDWISDMMYEYAYGSYEWDEAYVGLSPYDLRDDETGAEFKARAKKYVDDLLGGDHKCQWHKRAYYS